MVEGLQAALNVNERACPIENCTFTIQSGVIENLHKHVAVHHFGQLHQIMDDFKREGNTHAMGLVFDFVSNFTGVEEIFPCSYCR